MQQPTKANQPRAKACVRTITENPVSKTMQFSLHKSYREIFKDDTVFVAIPDPDNERVILKRLGVHLDVV